MKRLLLAAVVLSAIGVVGASQAYKCTPYVAVGDHGEATVTFTQDGQTVNIHTAAFGNFAVGPVTPGNGRLAKCPSGIQPTTGFVTVKVDGVTVCKNTNKPPAFDPFVFGGGIHNDPDADPCGADVVWDGLSWFISPSLPPGPPDPIAVGGNKRGVWAGDEQPAIVTGFYWYGGTTYNVPDGTVGWFSNHGVQVAKQLQ